MPVINFQSGRALVRDDLTLCPVYDVLPDTPCHTCRFGQGLCFDYPMVPAHGLDHRVVFRVRFHGHPILR
jgi:hypothetical protein